MTPVRKSPLRGLFLCLAGLLYLAACSKESEQQTGQTQLPCDPENAGLTLPDGFCAMVVADNLGVIRHLVVNSNGDLYVSMRHQRLKLGGITAMRDEDNDGRMDRFERLSHEPGMGIDIYNKQLIFASDERVLVYSLNDGQLIPDEPPAILIDGFPQQQRHSGKPFALDKKGGLYINVGAVSNACQKEDRVAGGEGINPCPELEQHAGIWKFSDHILNQDFHDNGEHYAKGIRNAYAIDWHPLSDKLYVTQHGRDQLHELWPDLYTDELGSMLPSEEMIEVTQGQEYGWPYCYYNQIQNKRVLSPEYGGDGNSSDGCEKYPDPVIAFPGHYGPNDLTFYNASQFPEEYRHGAFIAFHGSYNRGSFEQVGYQVVFVPFNKQGVSGEWRVFADDFAGKKTLHSPQDADYRPTGLAVGPKGSLYITDSVQGRIWKVSYVDEQNVISTQ